MLVDPAIRPSAPITVWVIFVPSTLYVIFTLKLKFFYIFNMQPYSNYIVQWLVYQFKVDKMGPLCKSTQFPTQPI